MKKDNISFYLAIFLLLSDEFCPCKIWKDANYVSSGKKIEIQCET